MKNPPQTKDYFNRRTGKICARRSTKKTQRQFRRRKKAATETVVTTILFLVAQIRFLSCKIYNRPAERFQLFLFFRKMKKLTENKTLLAVFFSLSMFVAAFVVVSQSIVKPQAQTLISTASRSEFAGSETSGIKNPAAPPFSSVAVSNRNLIAAVSQNVSYKNNLTWAFGGKTQRGWYLYESLIGRLINTESGADSAEFADALAKWQQSVGLNPSGILDDAALAAIIKTWQSNRLKFSGAAAPDELVTAPATDFWDETRAEDLRRVESATYAAYKKMVAAAIADKSLNLKIDEKGNLAAEEKFLKIVSSYRSREHQERLRRASPNSGRAGLAVNSPHFTGRALDIYVGGEPVTTRDDNRAVQIKTPVYRWLVKNAARFGFKPYFYEPWHWEYAPDEAK